MQICRSWNGLLGNEVTRVPNRYYPAAFISKRVGKPRRISSQMGGAIQIGAREDISFPHAAYSSRARHSYWQALRSTRLARKCRNLAYAWIINRVAVSHRTHDSLQCRVHRAVPAPTTGTTRVQRKCSQVHAVPDMSHKPGKAACPILASRQRSVIRARMGCCTTTRTRRRIV